jgi:hypothetical protein
MQKFCREGEGKTSAPGNLLHTHWPVTVASFRTWRGWRDCVAQDPAH